MLYTLLCGVWHDRKYAEELPDETDAVLCRELTHTDGTQEKEITWEYWNEKENTFICMEYGTDEGMEIYDVLKYYLPHPINAT